MDIETVIFSSVYSNNEERYTNNQLFESQGIPVPFHNTQDYIGQVAVDLTKIVGFEEGQVSYNGDILDCVYGMYDAQREEEIIYTRNLLVDKEEFKEMLEYVHNTKILLASEYIKQIRDASNKKVN